MSAAQLDALETAALARLTLWIARSAAQQKRRMIESWGSK
ncbi:MAG: hypothetical protein RL032_1106 [Pseudomonadota bacterium]